MNSHHIINLNTPSIKLPQGRLDPYPKRKSFALFLALAVITVTQVSTHAQQDPCQRCTPIQTCQSSLWEQPQKTPENKSPLIVILESIESNNEDSLHGTHTTNTNTNPNKPDSSLILGEFSKKLPLNSLPPETLKTGQRVSIYILCNNPDVEIAKITITSPTGNVVFSENIAPIKTQGSMTTWPSISMYFDLEGTYKVMGAFQTNSGEVLTSSSDILMLGAPTHPTQKKGICSWEGDESEKVNEPLESDMPLCSIKHSNPNIDRQALQEILNALKSQTPKTNYQPPYTKKETIETIKNYFKVAGQGDGSPLISPSRAKMVDLAKSLNDPDGARWIIETLPLWRELDDASPSAQVAQKAAELARPDDLALLMNLLECQIPEAGKLWGLSILSRITNPINTDFLQVIVLEATLLDATGDNPNERMSKDWSSANVDDWSPHKAALESLTRLGTKRSLLFLLGLHDSYCNDTGYQADKEKDNIEFALLSCLPPTQEVSATLDSILEPNNGFHPDTIQLVEKLKYTLGGLTEYEETEGE
jgi:hypothetical protein